jgi:hypothetical protein
MDGWTIGGGGTSHGHLRWDKAFAVARADSRRRLVAPRLVISPSDDCIGSCGGSLAPAARLYRMAGIELRTFLSGTTCSRTFLANRSVRPFRTTHLDKPRAWPIRAVGRVARFRWPATGASCAAARRIGRCRSHSQAASRPSGACRVDRPAPLGGVRRGGGRHAHTCCCQHGFVRYGDLAGLSARCRRVRPHPAGNGVRRRVSRLGRIRILDDSQLRRHD